MTEQTVHQSQRLIDQYRDVKRGLEKAIERSIWEYQNQTGFRVTGIKIDHIGKSHRHPYGGVVVTANVSESPAPRPPAAD